MFIVAVVAAVGCGGDDIEYAEVGEAKSFLGWYRGVNLVSPGIPGVPPEALPSHTVSVAVSDGLGTTSDVVVAYERNGESWRSWGGLTCCVQGGAINWNKAGGGMPAPAQGPTDTFTFGKYEGWPTVLAFQDSQGGTNPLERHFLYVTKFGSSVNGSTVTSGSGGRFSTDVAVLRSVNGGVSFVDGTRLTSPPPPSSNIARWKIEFPVAGNMIQPGDFYNSWTVVAWKQTPVFTNGTEGTASWKARYVHATYTATTGFTPALWNEPFTLPVPADRGPISVAGRYPNDPNTIMIASPGTNTMRLLADGVTWDPRDRCPNPTSTSVPMTWRFMTTVCSLPSGTCGPPTEETVFTDSQWRICVGASRDPFTGTPWNKQMSQPRMVVDPVTKDVYVAVTTNVNNAGARSRLRLFRKSGTGAFTQIFETPPTTILHDEWAPVLGVYHYPGETADIFVSRRSTNYDTVSPTRNERINRVASRSGDAGATWEQAFGWAIDGLSSPLPVQSWLGAYDGAMGVPYITEGWQAAWADPRNPPTAKVYAGTAYP